MNLNRGSFFLQKKIPARLTRLRDKYIQLKKLGIDRLIVINFNHAFANINANDFVECLLVEKLGVKYLVVGDDFCFGADREGNFDYLQQKAETFNFDVNSTQSFTVLTERVSSTAIRDALFLGDNEKAQAMLGRSFSISGRVSHGNKLGRTIGFPTANVPLKRLVSPVHGVYVVNVLGIKDNNLLSGVANVGTRPTFEGVRQQLEVHLFDFSGDLYGQHIEVQLLHKLRDEMKFASLDALTFQINLDAQQARAWLAEQNNI